MTMHKLIILDRDGVINFDSKEFIKSALEWHPIPGSLEAIARLTQAGYKVAVATNQSGVGRGLFDLKILAEIHHKMLTLVREQGGEIDAIFFCPHLPNAECECRKPKPGLLHQARNYFQTDLKHVWAIGDSKRDIEAAVAAGAQPVLVKTGNGTQVAHENPSFPYPVFDDLNSAVEALLCAN